jgi:UDP-glucuronate 4-epimerase
MPTILVTGSAGFIGFYVAKTLLAAGHTVVGIDNFNAYYAAELKRARTDILSGWGNFLPVEIDLADTGSTTRCCMEYRPEIICHLAAQAGVRYSLINPHTYERANLAGFINLIENARSLSVKRFVYASSSSVYGGNIKLPYSEDDPVNTPVSLYAATKRANELIAYTYNHLYGLQTIGLRFFTVYGEWGRPDMAYWSFLENILNGEPIRVFNHGMNRRYFTYIDDIISGVTTSLTSIDLDGYEIINLGNNNPVELLDFIDILEDLAGKPAIKQMVAAQPGDVVATYADITRARKKLGFEPETSIRQGLERFVSWYRDFPDLMKTVREHRLVGPR